MTAKMMKGINICVIFFLTNCLWVLGIIAGLFFIGLIPSTNGILAIFEDKDLFEHMSYTQMFKVYLNRYKETLLDYKWRIILSPVLIGILYLDLLVIQANEMIQAIFYWPIILVMGYLVLISLGFLVQGDKTLESFVNRLKAAVTLPFLMPGVAILTFLLFGSFLVISIRYFWFAMVSGSLFIYFVQNMLKKAYIQKKLMKN